MRWEVGQGVRCDLVAYAGPNLSGKRQVMQLYPTGARRGRIDEEVRSMVIRAFPGTRIVLCASNRDAWELAAWRCIRILEGSSLASEQRNGLRGVRVPDLGVAAPLAGRLQIEISRSITPSKRSVEREPHRGICKTH